MIFKTLPSIISSINQLGEASNKLKAINFSMVGLNAGNLDAYRNAISGISKEQAALLLSTQGLNQAQIDLVLSNEKVTASEIAEAATLDGVAKKKSILTVEQQKQLVSSQALTTEKLAEISATLGLETAENGSLISKKALNVEMVKQQLESIGIVGSTQAQIMSMLGLTTAETSAATASNVLSGAMAKLSLAMSTNPIGALITVIGIAVVSVYGLTKAFDALTDSAEEIDERVDDLISKYNDLKTTADNNASTVESLADEYESLSKGVNDLGENVSLTSEEYARYNEIVNQMADMFPTLITGYTDEGTAILSLKGNVEQLRDAYKEAQQEAYNLLVATGKDSDGNDIMESYKNLSELDWWDSSIGAEDVTTTVKRDITKQILDLMSNMDTAVEEYNKLAQTIFDTYGDKGYNFLEEMGLPAIKDVFSDTSGITEEALIAGRATVQSYYQGFQSEIDTKLSKVKLMANAFLNTNDFYLDNSTNSELKNALSVMVNSIDEELANSFNGEQVKVGAYVNNIVNSIKGNEEVQKELVDLFTIDTTDMPVSDIAEQINGYINSIAIAINEDPEELKVRLGFDYVDDLEAQYQRAVDFAKDKFDGYDPTAFFKEHSINTQEEIDAWQKIAQGARDAAEAEKEYIQGSTLDKTTISSFTDAWEQLKSSTEDATKDLANNLTELAEQGRLTVEAFNEADSTGYFEGLNISAEEAVQKINALVSSSTQLQSMSAQISKMSDMLADKKNGNAAKASDLAGFDAEVRGLDSWKEFESVMGSSKSTMEQCQEAANNLATEFVNSNNFLANLNETNKDYYITALQNMGVENAEEIVKDALVRITQAQSLEEEFLAQKKRETGDATYSLINATADEITKFAEERGYTNDVTNALIELALKKQLVNGTTLDFSGDLANISNYVKALGGTANAIGLLNRIKKGEVYMPGDAMASVMASAQAEIDAAMASGQKTNVQVMPTGSSGYKSSGSKSKSGGSGSSKQQIDWIERRLQVLQNTIDKTKAKFDNLFSVKSKANNLKEQIKQTTALMKAQQKAASTYKKYADKVKFSPSLKKKVREGSYNISDYKSETQDKIQKYQDYYDKYKDLSKQVLETEKEIRELKISKYQLYVDDADAKASRSQSYAELNAGNYKKQNKHLEAQAKSIKESYKWQIKIAKLNKDSVEVSRLKAELQKELNDLIKQQYDNIVNTYENKIGLTDNKIKAFQDQISLIEAKGERIGSALYTKQMSLDKTNLDKLVSERKSLIKKLAEIPKGTDDWYDAQDTLFGVDSQITQLNTDIASLQKSINQLNFDRFNDLLDSLDDITDESQFLKDMLSDTLFDDNGKITDDGMTAIGLSAMDYDVYMAKADKYKQQIAELQSMFEKGLIGEADYEKQLREYKNGQMDAIKSANEAKKAVISYVKDGLDAQNKALEEAVSKQKELLDSEKDLYDFQQKIADQNKNIADLKKQINALEGDDSEENRKKLQELRAQLADAEKEQKDTLYDRSIDDQKNALDDMLENSKKQAEDYLKDTDKVLADAFVYVNEHSSQIAANIENIAKETGYDISNYIVNAWKDSGDAVGKYSDTLSSNVPNIISQISLITDQWRLQTEAIEKASQAAVDYATKSYLEHTGVGFSGQTGTSKFANLQNIQSKTIEDVVLSGRNTPNLNVHIPDINRNIPVPNFTPMSINIDSSVNVEGVATDKIVRDFEGIAKRQAENVVGRINSLTYAKGVRRR